MARALWLAVVLAACSGGSGQPAKQPDGGYRLSCNGPLTDCLLRADRLCREQGYTVSEARDRRELLGHEQGQSLIEVRKSEATIYCGKSAPPAERPIVEMQREPPVAPPAPAAKPAPAPAAPGACVPGSTQACVGPGGCSGGQACSVNGTHFEACDCGPKTDTPH